jgi:hypothetical protein
MRDDSTGCDPDVNADSGAMDIILRIRCYIGNSARARICAGPQPGIA